MGNTIAALLQKGKFFLLYSGRLEEVYEALILVAVALGAFACGRLSVIDARTVPVVITRGTDTASSSSKIGIGQSEEGSQASHTPGSVVASRNGTKYHLPSCPGAESIKEENKIWFPSEAEAQKAGYTKAGNCK